MRVAKLHEDAIIPIRKYKGDAGFDLYCISDYPVEIPALGFAIISTGITIEIPRNVVGIIKPKSGTNFLILGGVIDSSYQGEILVKLFNTTVTTMISHGDQIAQILFLNLIGGDSWDFTEAPLDEIHVVKSLRHTSGGIKTGRASSVEILDSNHNVWTEDMIWGKE